MRLLVLAAASFSLALALASAAPSADQGWTVTDLGVGPGSMARAINNAGEVVGIAPTQGFLWDHGTVTYLGPGTQAFGINNRGDIVGSYYDGSTQYAVVWHHGVMTELPSLGGGFSVAYGINDRGDIVGQSAVPRGFGHAVLWRDGQALDLGTLCVTRVICYSGAGDTIDDRDDVVGESVTESGATHAFIWKDGVMTDLDTVDPDSRAFAINSKGDIVGSYSPGLGDQSSALWHDGSIGPLGISGSAFGINNRGEVAGDTFTGGSEVGYVWEKGVTTYLPTPAGGESFVLAINGGGQVAGSTWSGADEPGHAAVFTRN